MECNEEDWSIECSDDEKYEMDGKVNKKKIIKAIIYSFTWFTLFSLFLYFDICLE